MFDLTRSLNAEFHLYNPLETSAVAKLTLATGHCMQIYNCLNCPDLLLWLASPLDLWFPDFPCQLTSVIETGVKKYGIRLQELRIMRDKLRVLYYIRPLSYVFVYRCYTVYCVIFFALFEKSEFQWTLADLSTYFNGFVWTHENCRYIFSRACFVWTQCGYIGLSLLQQFLFLGLMLTKVQWTWNRGSISTSNPISAKQVAIYFSTSIMTILTHFSNKNTRTSNFSFGEFLGITFVEITKNAKNRLTNYVGMCVLKIVIV